MTAVPYRSVPTPAERRRLEELAAELMERGVLADAPVHEVPSRLHADPEAAPVRQPAPVRLPAPRGRPRKWREPDVQPKPSEAAPVAEATPEPEPGQPAEPDWRNWRPRGPRPAAAYRPPTCPGCGAYRPDHLLTCERDEHGDGSS